MAAVEKLDPNTTLDPYEIIELLDARKRQYAIRDSLYETFQSYYRGRQGGNTPSVQGANSQGRPLLRLSESPNQTRTYSAACRPPASSRPTNPRPDCSAANC